MSECDELVPKYSCYNCNYWSDPDVIEEIGTCKYGSFNGVETCFDFSCNNFERK